MNEYSFTITASALIVLAIVGLALATKALDRKEEREKLEKDFEEHGICRNCVHRKGNYCFHIHAHLKGLTAYCKGKEEEK